MAAVLLGKARSFRLQWRPSNCLRVFRPEAQPLGAVQDVPWLDENNRLSLSPPWQANVRPQSMSGEQYCNAERGVAKYERKDEAA